MRGGEPPKDSDHDGMADDWERQVGLNPQDPADASRDRDGDGYTNLEAYLLGLTGMPSTTRSSLRHQLEQPYRSGS